MLGMSKIGFIIVFELASDRMVDMIQVFLDNQFGYYCCTGVPQAQVMSSRVQARTERLCKK